MFSSEIKIRVQGDPERLEQWVDNNELEFHKENHKELYLNLIH